jgi:nucleoside triphosphate diphosphatase
MQEPSALGRAIPLVRDLRNRCPWDGAQTATTLRPYLVEEALELDQALGQGEAATVRDELGDVLLHLAFQIVLAEDAGQFGPEDVVAAVERKMWRRHPHLFSATPDGTTPGQAPDHASWERTKARERAAGDHGVLEGLPPSLPALIMAYRLQERAAGVGFDWPDATGPADKVREELVEVEQEMHADPVDRARLEHEIGDLLFAVVNLARKLGCDARAALEQANARFRARFRHMERQAQARGVRIGDAGLEELDALWTEAKRAGDAPG